MLDKIIKGRYSSTDFKLQVILCHRQTSAPRDWESLGWRSYVNKGSCAQVVLSLASKSPHSRKCFIVMQMYLISSKNPLSCRSCLNVSSPYLQFY